MNKPGCSIRRYHLKSWSVFARVRKGCPNTQGGGLSFVSRSRTYSVVYSTNASIELLTWLAFKEKSRFVAATTSELSHDDFMLEKPCVVCRIMFEAKSPRTLCCSRQCRMLLEKKRRTLLENYKDHSGGETHKRLEKAWKFRTILYMNPVKSSTTFIYIRLAETESIFYSSYKQVCRSNEAMGEFDSQISP